MIFFLFLYHLRDTFYLATMNIYYQWEPGSYSHLASLQIQDRLNILPEEVIWLFDFDSVWEMISQGHIGVLPIENSYAGTIHHNMYNFLKYPHCILWEYDFQVRHCLLSLENDISQVKKAYSHHQALSQTHLYLKSHNIFPEVYGDTAGAAKMIQEEQKKWVAAVASQLAAEIYGLNILARDIQDQEGNTTKFLIVTKKEDTEYIFSQKANKITLIFTTYHTPWALYDCLGEFATRKINLTKIESIPKGSGHFQYSFWVTLQGNEGQEHIAEALKNLEQKTQMLKILGNY